jgi:hypothetical protein
VRCDAWLLLGPPACACALLRDLCQHTCLRKHATSRTSPPPPTHTPPHHHTTTPPLPLRATHSFLNAKPNLEASQEQAQRTHAWRQELSVDSVLLRPCPKFALLCSLLPTYLLTDDSPEGNAVMLMKASVCVCFAGGGGGGGGAGDRANEALWRVLTHSWLAAGPALNVSWCSPQVCGVKDLCDAIFNTREGACARARVVWWGALSGSACRPAALCTRAAPTCVCVCTHVCGTLPAGPRNTRVRRRPGPDHGGGRAQPGADQRVPGAGAGCAVPHRPPHRT